MTAYFKAGCESEKVLGAKKEDVGYIVISFDFVAMFFLWIMLQIHGSYEDKEEKEIEGIVLDGSDFTLDVKNIPPHVDVRVLKAQMWRHIEGVLKEHNEYAVHDTEDPNACKVAQLNFALTKYTIMQYYKLRIWYEKQDRIFNLRISILEKSKADEKKKEKKRDYLLKQIQINKERYELNEERIVKCKNDKSVRAIKIYVTMQSMEGKKSMMKAFRAPTLRRC